MVATIKKFGELPAAKEPPPGPPPPDAAAHVDAPVDAAHVEGMAEEDHRATLEAAGVPAEQSDDAPALRANVRKMQSTYLDTCNKQKTGASGSRNCYLFAYF